MWVTDSFKNNYLSCILLCMQQRIWEIIKMFIMLFRSWLLCTTLFARKRRLKSMGLKVLCMIRAITFIHFSIWDLRCIFTFGEMHLSMPVWKFSIVFEHKKMTRQFSVCNSALAYECLGCCNISYLMCVCWLICSFSISHTLWRVPSNPKKYEHFFFMTDINTV